MHPAKQAEFEAALKDGFPAIKSELEKVHAQEATAYSPADVQKVKEMIEGTVGFEQVNKEVKTSLKVWMLRTFARMLGFNDTQVTIDLNA
jgi:hypothetical protein